MLRVAVQNIQPGMVLARPIPLPQDPRRFLLQRDHEIPVRLIPRLQQLGILEVWVRHADLAFLEDLIDEGLGDRQREVYTQVRENFESIIRGSTAALDMSSFEDSVSELFGFLKASYGSDILLQKLDAFDNYLMSHSTNVCYLALLLGMKLDRYLIEQRHFKTAKDAKDLTELGLGSLLHDIGKMKVPKEILDKPGRLTDDEMATMRSHARCGYDLVRDCLPATASQIVLNHHQRWDGSGYPGRMDSRTKREMTPLRGQQIPIFSRIAIVADIYDAATTRRCYSQAKPPVQVLHEMRTWCQGFFDPVVEAAFYRIVPPFPIGQVVTLSDGVEAVVIDFNADYPVSPRVQCLRDPHGKPFTGSSLEEIDLTYYDDIEIVSVDGQDVREFTAIQQVNPPEAVAVY